MHYKQYHFSYYIFFLFFLFITLLLPSVPARNVPSQVMPPRFGMPDNNKLHTTTHYSFLTGWPNWKHSTVPLMLTYALSPEHVIDYINLSDIRVALERAFSTWSSVIPVNFTETQDYKHANITIGFFYGDHGDGNPFDDTVLAHATGPGTGAFIHFNAGITWAIDFNSKEPEQAFDLESVAIHEMGHVLGLDHSSFKEAFMWNGTPPRTKNVVLALDDVNGAQALYGANPNLNPPKIENAASRDSSFGLGEINIIFISIVVKALFFL